MAITALEPVPLEELAEHLRDQTWLDMRVVEHGFLKRVRVFEIRIRRDEDFLAAEQEFLRGTEVHRTEHVLPQDGVRWARPTEFSIEDIEGPTQEVAAQVERADEWAAFEANPLDTPLPSQDNYTRKRLDQFKAKEPNLWGLRGVILMVVAAKWGILISSVLSGTKQHETHARKWGIRMMWELTDIPQSDIPELFGYTGGGIATYALNDTKKAQDARTTSARNLLIAVEKTLGQPWAHRRGPLAPASRQTKLL